MKWYRCEFFNEEDDVGIQIDVLVDEDKVVEPLPMFFGYWDADDEVRKEPFLLDFKNEIEWGTTHQSTFDLRGKRLVEGLKVAYIGFETSAARERNEEFYKTTFTLDSYRDFAS